MMSIAREDIKPGWYWVFDRGEVPAISQDGAAHWLPRPLRDFTLAVMNFVRGP